MWVGAGTGAGVRRAGARGRTGAENDETSKELQCLKFHYQSFWPRPSQNNQSEYNFN